MMSRGGAGIADKRAAVRNTLRNMMHSGIEVLWYPYMSKAVCSKLFVLEGLEYLDKAVSSGRGTVLLHGHFGNPHLIMPAIGHAGHKLSQVASRIPPPRFPGLPGAVLYRLRCRVFQGKLRYKEALPVEFIYTDRSMREVFRRLHGNEIVAIGIDGREGANGIELDFIGGRGVFFTGTMRILRRVRPTILPVFHVRNYDGTHRIVIEKPFELEVTSDEENDVIVNTKNYLRILETYIYRYPDHYARLFCMDKPFVSAA